MTEPLRVGELVQYYRRKYDATVVGEVIELPNEHQSVRIRIVKSPYPHLVGQEWPVSPHWVFRAGGQPRAFIGGQVSYEEHLVEIRDRVLSNLPPELEPVEYTQEPTKEVRFAYDPEWVSYHIWTHPRHLELKLTLQIKDDKKRKSAYALLRERESEIRAALRDVEFNWKASPPKTVFEKITWPGKEGPRWQDIDHIVERFTLYIRTLQPILKNL